MEMAPKFRSVTAVALRNVGFCLQLLFVEFVVDGMSVEQDFLLVCSEFPLLITIPPLLPANINSRQGSMVSLPQFCRSIMT